LEIPESNIVGDESSAIIYFVLVQPKIPWARLFSDRVGTLIAVKEYRSDLAYSVLGKYSSEVLPAASFLHENVVRAFAVLVTGSCSLVASFPYYNQGSLEMVIRKRKSLELDKPLAEFFCATTSFPERINAVLGLLNDVRHIHSKGIVHNNLTLRNILVNFEIEKLALTVSVHDFGTATKLVKNETHISFQSSEEERSSGRKTFIRQMSLLG
jgi:serine/threonine protein kinase